MFNWTINFIQGQWHKFFGHPMDAVRSESTHQPGLCQVTFTCKECGRSFPKHICSLNSGEGLVIPCKGRGY